MASNNESQFDEWESDFADIEAPVFSDLDFEDALRDIEDPIEGAKLLDNVIRRESPDVRNSLLKRAVDAMNYKYTYGYLNRGIDVTVDRVYTPSSPAQIMDNMEMLGHLANHGRVRLGGRMGFFEVHEFGDSKGELIWEISLRLHSSGYLENDLDSRRIKPIENYATIPISVIEDYRIMDREL